jgi:pyruvate-formate lyase
LRAVQAVRLYHLICWKESSDRPEVSGGQLDQILYPYYIKDKKEGRVTPQEAASCWRSLA